MQSKEDPNKLVAIFVQHGLENLGKYSTFEETVTAVPELLNKKNFLVNKGQNEKDNRDVEMRFLRAAAAYRITNRTWNYATSK